MLTRPPATVSPQPAFRSARRYASVVLAGAIAVISCSDSAGPYDPPGADYHRIVVSATGQGSITSSPSGIACTVTSVVAGSCTSEYAAGTSVVLTATPAAGFAFGGWSENGQPVSANASLTFTASADRTLEASFAGIGTVTVVAAGTVRTLDGTLPPGLRAIIASGSNRTSVPVGANGAFTITADVTPGSYDVIIDVEGTARTMHPALVRRQTGTVGSPLGFLLVPLQWTISGGTYAGETVDISVDAAFRPPCTTPGDTNCDGFYPEAWATGVKLWPAASLPIPVAFDRARSTDPISAADSVAFWNIIDRMNADYGKQLFQPTSIDKVAILSGEPQRPDRAIVIRIDNTLSGFGAWTNWWWDGAGNLYSGVVRPRTPGGLASDRLMTHELLHTQSIKHSCSWVTTMGGYGCSSNPGLSPQDVAYAQLAERIGNAERTTGAVHTLVAARNGQRVVLLGGLPLVTVRAGLAALRSDGTDHAH